MGACIVRPCENTGILPPAAGVTPPPIEKVYLSMAGAVARLDAREPPLYATFVVLRESGGFYVLLLKYDAKSSKSASPRRGMKMTAKKHRKTGIADGMSIDRSSF